MRVVDATANHRVDIYVEVGVFGQQLQLLVEHLQRLLGNVVGHDIVDTDLEVIEAGAIQPLDAVGRKQIAVRNNGGDDRVLANVSNELIQLGMQKWFAA